MPGLQPRMLIAQVYLPPQESTNYYAEPQMAGSIAARSAEALLDKVTGRFGSDVIHGAVYRVGSDDSMICIGGA